MVKGQKKKPSSPWGQECVSKWKARFRQPPKSTARKKSTKPKTQSQHFVFNSRRDWVLEHFRPKLLGMVRLLLGMVRFNGIHCFLWITTFFMEFHFFGFKFWKAHFGLILGNGQFLMEWHAFDLQLLQQQVHSGATPQSVRGVILWLQVVEETF